MDSAPVAYHDWSVPSPSHPPPWSMSIEMDSPLFPLSSSHPLPLSPDGPFAQFPIETDSTLMHSQPTNTNNQHQHQHQHQQHRQSVPMINTANGLMELFPTAQQQQQRFGNGELCSPKSNMGMNFTTASTTTTMNNNEYLHHRYDHTNVDVFHSSHLSFSSSSSSQPLSPNDSSSSPSGNCAYSHASTNSIPSYHSPIATPPALLSSSSTSTSVLTTTPPTGSIVPVSVPVMAAVSAAALPKVCVLATPVPSAPFTAQTAVAHAHTHQHSNNGHHSHVAPHPHSHPPSRIAKKACSACRKLKASCDNNRPCHRCVKFGRECIDQPTSESTANTSQSAKSDTKSPPSTAATTTATVTATATKTKGHRKSAPPSHQRQQHPPPPPPPPSSSKMATNSSHKSVPSHRHKRAAPSSTSASTASSSSSPSNSHTHTPSSASSSASLNSSATTPEPIPSAHHFTELFDYVASSLTDVSVQLFSRTLLAVLLKEKVRDTVLILHSQIDELPLDLPHLLEFHTQCAMMCVQFSVMMTNEDFLTFLTDGLTEEQLNSTLWLNSPLAPWTKLSTRPLFLAIHPISPSQNLQQNPSTGVPILDGPAEFRIDYLPSANVAYQRWQRLMIAKILFDRELRAERSKSKKTPVFLIEDEAEMLKHLGPLEQLYDPDADTYDKFQLLDSDEMDEIDSIENQFNLLDISPSLAARPPLEKEDDIVSAPVHAQWCPLFGSALEDDTPIGAQHEHFDSGAGVKVKREAGMESVHSPAPSAALLPLPISACMCSLSTPLPSRVFVNSSFERTFGWRRIEVERGLLREGMPWVRHLAAPRAWLADHIKSAQHWKRQIRYVGTMALFAARVAANLPTTIPANCEKFFQPEPWGPDHDIIRTKHGQLRPVLYRRVMKVRQSDGVLEPSGLSITWKETTVSVPPRK